MFIFPLHLRNILAAKDEKNCAMNFGYSLWASSLASLNYATMQKQIFLIIKTVPLLCIIDDILTMCVL